MESPQGWQITLRAFVGCFAALVAMAEVTPKNKLVRYLAALLIGVVLAFVLGAVLDWVAGIFARV